MRPLDEGRADRVRAGRDGEAELERVLPAAPAELALRDATVVDRDLEQVRLARAARELDVHDVLGVDGEIARGDEAPACPHRQPGQFNVLRQLERQAMDVDHRRHRGIADGETRDLLRGREIALHDRRRDEEQVRDIVEAALRVVGGQQQLEVHLRGQVLECEQVADGIAVLGPRQPVQLRQRAGVRRGRGGTVELALEPGKQLRVGRRLRARLAGRRHVRAPELVRDLFPDLGVGADVAEQVGVELEVPGEIDPVMAIDAVALDRRGHQPPVRIAAVQVPGQYAERAKARSADQRQRRNREPPPRHAHRRPRQVHGHCIFSP